MLCDGESSHTPMLLEVQAMILLFQKEDSVNHILKRMFNAITNLIAINKKKTQLQADEA